MVKNPFANAGDLRDTGPIPGLGRSSGEESDDPLQYSCLESSMDRRAWWATVHKVAKTEATWHTHTHTHTHTHAYTHTHKLYLFVIKVIH